MSRLERFSVKSAPLSEYSAGRDNNFNLIRMFAAFGVLVSHAFPLSMGSGASMAWETHIGLSLGTMCVAIFFVLSGFLITRSFDLSLTLRQWIMARVLRIFPGLIVVLALTAFILGPLVTEINLQEYFSSKEVFAYVPVNALLAWRQKSLPGVFEQNPWPLGTNGSLWTLFYEAMCYLGVFAFGILGIFRSRAAFLIVLVVFFILYFIVVFSMAGAGAPQRVSVLVRLGLPFALGAAFYVFRQSIVLDLRLGIIVLVPLILSSGTEVFYEVIVFSIAYWVFLLAYLPGGMIRRLNRLGDYSYGFYIYAFPVQQVVAWAFPGSGPIFNIGVAGVITLICACFSWHLVEFPALKLKGRFGGQGNRKRDFALKA